MKVRDDVCGWMDGWINGEGVCIVLCGGFVEDGIKRKYIYSGNSQCNVEIQLNMNAMSNMLGSFVH